MQKPDPHKSITSSFDETLSSVISIFFRIRNEINAIDSNQVVNYLNTLQRLPDDMKPVVRKFMDHGWFISNEMGLRDWQELSRLINEEQFEKVEAKMIELVSSEAEKIIDRAATRFPSRNSVLNSALSAHNLELYDLSVPVLLIQTEGMCLELFGKQLYAKDKGIPKIKPEIDALIDGGLDEVIFQPLRETHGLQASEDYRKQWPDALNRHEILHGKVVDYGTRINSLKTLSFLDYFVTFVCSNKRLPIDDNS
ncbi:hypothetical protein [Methyloglobulus sp.]|uniref:hypothetical protein n=1 Tax=Methyloglobulus sp. TaxID=2518622 RepID=UPI0017D92C39|nr:hypothetical protein [Methyloglobulus sp.]